MLNVLSVVSHGKEAGEIFVQEAPAGLIEDLALLVEASMRTAWTQGIDLPPGNRHDRYPYDFRSNVEAALMNLANTYEANGVTAREVANEAGNWHHTEVRFGSIVLTGNAVESPQTMVREASFRKSLAKNPQMSLDLVPMEPEPPSTSLYAVLLYPSAHFALRLDDAVPSFVTVRFPMSDLTDWLPDQVNALRALRDRREGGKQAAQTRLTKRADEDTG